MKPNTIYLIIATIVVAFGAYWYFFTGTGNQPPLSTAMATNPAQVRFQTLVGELQPISFNTAIFSDPRFDALVDITTSISPESSGRSDPLAPFSGGSAAAAPNPVASSTAATGGHP
ncbi:MAG TPA: hypothetical protein PLW99_02660 [Candidatus Paceibacterota bacterium]|nr:MAG: hypothetical protein B7X03_01955 [Parcubacteria group bacterium 21-58-10]HQT83024.1 hypothetical protein [Candidatus Paceibacterota bacterium]